MLQQKFEKKGKFRFQESWVFPYEVDEFIRAKLTEFQINQKSVCHVFCGKSEIGGLRIDIDEKLKPDLRADCLQLPKILGIESQANIMADFPWMIGYADRRYFSYALRDICKVGGYLFLNAPWNPWVDGLELVQVWKVLQAFNSYRDLVDWWIFKKIKKTEKLTEYADSASLDLYS